MKKGYLVNPEIEVLWINLSHNNNKFPRKVVLPKPSLWEVIAEETFVRPQGLVSGILLQEDDYFYKLIVHTSRFIMELTLGCESFAVLNQVKDCIFVVSNYLFSLSEGCSEARLTWYDIYIRE